MKWQMVLGFCLSLFLIEALSFSPKALAIDNLIVTDIDDTLKIAHIMDTREMVDYGRDTTSYFTGMNKLLRVLQESTHSKVIYLSNAPTFLMERTHTKFLEDNGFPAGPYLGRKSLSDHSFKLTELRRILSEEKPKRVILIGDNGEADSEIYHQIVNENVKSNIQFVQFVHLVYSSKDYVEPGKVIAPEQIGFATAADLALELNQLEWIGKSESQGILDFIIMTMKQIDFDARMGQSLFPNFKSCQDYKWRWDSKIGDLPFLSDYKDLITARCERPPSASL